MEKNGAGVSISKVQVAGQLKALTSTGKREASYGRLVLAIRKVNLPQSLNQRHICGNFSDKRVFF